MLNTLLRTNLLKRPNFLVGYNGGVLNLHVHYSLTMTSRELQQKPVTKQNLSHCGIKHLQQQAHGQL